MPASRVAALVFAVGALAACSGPNRDPAAALRAQVPGAARLLEAGRRTSWTADGAGSWTARIEGEPRSDLPPGVQARAKGQKVSVSLGERYEDGYAVAPGGNSAFGLRVHPLAGSGPVSIGPDGLARAMDIERGVDALHVVSPDGLEELLLSRDPTLDEVDYAIERGPGIARLRIASSGTVEALDARGEARLRSPAPVIVDANGQRRRGAWTLRGEELSARWSNEGLAFPIAVDPGWFSTNTMNDARLNFSATLMPDGSVLACGGSGDGTETDGETYVLNSCESFQQATGIWTYAAPLNTARWLHTATLLPDGTVLVTGGSNAAGAYLNSAELYKNGTWTLVSSTMTSGRAYHTATLLSGPNGPEVLLAGGISDSGTPGNYVYTYRPDADLYNVGTGTFAGTAIPMVSIHADHTATLLPNGTVLIAGGLNGPRSTTTVSKLAEVFVHTSGAGSFTATAPMTNTRQEATATVLPSGNVLVAGGQVSYKINGVNILDDGSPWTEIYTPTGTTSGAWTDGGQMNAYHSFHTATLLPGGEVAIYGGLDSNGFVSGTLEIWTDAGFGTGTTENNNGQASQEAVLLASGRVLVAGGVQDGGTVLNTSTVLDQNSPAFSLQSLPEGLSSPTVTPLTKSATSPPASNMVGPSLLVVADSDAGTGGSDGYLINESQVLGATAAPTITVTNTTVLGNASFPHFMTGHSATLLLDGRVLIVGGSSVTGTTSAVYNAYSDAFLFDPVALTYTELANALNQPRAYHTATLLPDGRVLVAGGDTCAGESATAKAQCSGTQAATNTTEIFSPETLAFSTGPSLPAARDGHTATLLPNATVLIAGGQSNSTTPLAQTELFAPTTNTLTAGAPLVYPRVGHKANVLPSGELILVGGACLTTTPPCIESFPPMEVYDDLSSPAEFTSLDEYYPYEQHTTLVLPSGDLFAFGGFNNYQLDNVIHPDITDSSALLFTRVQPASDITQSVPSQITDDGAYAQLLPSGRVAVVGGNLLDLFDPGLGYVDAWRPRITGVCISSTSCTVSTIASPIAPGSTITIGGTNLTGWNGSEAASGSASQSASNVPIVELQRIDSDYQQYLPFAGTAQFSATTVTSTIPSSVNPGWYRLTVVASGISSRPQYVQVGSTQLTTSSSLLAFGSVPTGTTSSAQAFTLTNSGAIPITVGPLAVPTGFTLSGGTLTNPGSAATSVNVLTGAQTLQSGGTLAINATFSPTSAISYSGLLSGNNIPTNLVTLTGTGIASIPSLTPASPLTLPATIVGQSSTTGNAITLTNNGTYKLTVNSFSTTGDFTAQGPAAPVIPPGGSASWDIVFSPKVTNSLTVNNESGSFTVLTDNGDPSITLQGTSLIPQGTISPTSVSFGNIAVGASAPTQTVTVTNNGTSALNIKEAAFDAGTNAGDFGLTTALPLAVLSDGGTQTLTFSFTPHASPGAAEGATVTFTSDDTVSLNSAASTNTIALSGTGLLATPSLTATSLNLGSVRENPTGGTTNKSTATVTLTNTGNTTMTITAAPIAGTNSGDFSVSPTTASINGGGNQVFTVTFTPHTAAAETATLSFTSATSIPSVALFGTGVFPAVTVAPTSLTFGSEPAGTASAPQTIVITNSGTAVLDFSASGATEPTLTGGNTADFTLSPASGALPQTLAAGASVSLSVTFNPSAAPATENLARTASLNIPNNDGLSIAAVPLAGTAALSLNASALQLPDQALGTTSTSTASTSGATANTVTLLNLSNAILSVDTVNTKFTGTNAADFSLVTTVGGSSTSSIASGATADFTFVFKPTQSSSASGKTLETATLNLVFLSGVTLTCAVSGNSIYALSAVSPTSLTLLGSTSTGIPTSGVRLGASTSTGGALTVTNSGALAMTLSSASFSGANAGDFSVAPASGSFPITLGASGSGSNTQSFTVSFSPKTTSAPGPETATLQFTSASGSPSVASVAVAGTSLFPAVAVKPTSIAFENQTAGTSSAQQTIVITNTGTDVLHFAASTSEPTLSGQAADFTVSPASGALPITLAAGASTSFAVIFAPPAGASGSPAATLTIANTDGLTIPTISLGGSVPALGSAALAIPDTALGSSSSSTAVVGTNTVQLTNPSSSALPITSATISGANASDFALLAGSPSSIAAGATGAFTVIFTPSLSGNTNGISSEVATLNIVTAAGSYSCGLSSHSLYAVAKLTAPATFPATPDGTTSGTSATATLSNTGQEPLSVTGYSTSGTDASDFAVTSVIPSSGNPLSVAAGGSANITFSFSPRAARAESATFGVVSNSGAASPTAALSGSGLGLSASALQLPDTVYRVASSSSVCTSVGGACTAVNTVTLQNPSSAALGVGAATFSGSNAGDFSLVAGSPSSIAAGGSGQWTVVFTPAVNSSSSGKSAESATLTIPTANGNLVCAVGANSVYPVATLSWQGASSFPPTAVGSTSSTVLTALITNSGVSALAPLSVTGIAISGTDAGDFAITSTVPSAGSPLSIASGAQSSVTLTFTPRATPARPETATLALTSSGGSPTLALAGSGAQATASIAPTSLTLVSSSGGGVRKGATSAPQTVTITNNGNSAMSVNGVSFTGANPTDFTVSPAPSGTSPVTIASGASNTATFTITFTPKTAAAESATLTFTPASGSPQVPSVALSGSGIYPVLSVQPTGIAFGNQGKGTNSAPSGVVITNTGSDTLNVNAITLSDSSDFLFSPALPALPFTLAAGASKSLGVLFAPQTAAALSSTLSVSSNDFPSAPATVALTGTGVLSTPSLSPATLALPDTALGASSSATPSANNTVTLGNSAGAALAVSSVSISGANKSDFAVAGGASSIAAGQSASWVVVFTPSSPARAESATLTVVTDNGSYSASLGGDGVNIVGTPTNLSFGNQRKGTPSASQSVTLTNTGSAALAVTASSSSADFVATLASGSTLPIASGKSASWNVVFMPGTASAEAAVLTFATGLGTSTVSLSGTGIYPLLSVQPATAAFGGQRIKTSSAAVDLVITNTGTDTLELTAPQLSDSTDYSLTLLDGGSVSSGGGASAVGPLAPSGSATLLLKFHPQATGGASATISVGSSDTGIAAQSVTASGNGTAPNPQLSASSLAFGSQSIGSSSTAKSVLVTNPAGTTVDTLNISGAAVSATQAADAADFLITAPASGAIAPGSAGQSWSVVFQPSAPARAETATLTLQSDSGPLTVALSGTGIAAIASANPSGLVFPAQPKGTSSQPLSLALVNSGSDVLSISGYGLSGANSNDFTVSSSATSLTPPTASTLPACTAQPCPSASYYVVFTPSTLSSESAALTFQTSAGAVVISLTGASVGAALVFDPDSVDFGNQRVDSSASPVAFQVTNAAAQTLTLTSFSLGGANASDFSVALADSNQSFPLTLATGASVNFSVDFTPAAVGPLAATFALIGSEAGSDAGTSGVILPLSGAGIAPTFDVAPSSIDFGQVRTGSSATGQTVTISNSGSDVLNIQQIVLNGAGATSFSLALPPGAMPVAVEPANTYAFQVGYAPTAVGQSSASATITTDDPLGATAQVPLEGEGISPQLAVAPIKLVFGAVRVGGNPQALALSLNNSGAASTKLNAATITGAAASDFTLPALPPLPALLAGGAAQSLVVLFTPSAHGDREASLSLATDVGTVTVPLSGSGLAAGIGVQPTSLNFGSVALGAPPQLLSLQIQNTGDAPLDLSLLSIDGPSAAAFRTTGVPDAGPLSPDGGTATFSVEYAPVAAASDTATLTLSSPDPSTPSVAVALAGVAVTPALTVTGPITFPQQLVGAIGAPQTVTITNTSAAPLVIESVSTSPADFAAVLAGAPVTLAPMATATVTVSFTPIKSGAVAGTLSVFVQGESAAVATSALSGTGQAASSGCGCSSSGPTDPGALFELALFAGLALQLRRRSRGGARAGGL